MLLLAADASCCCLACLIMACELLLNPHAAVQHGSKDMATSMYSTAVGCLQGSTRIRQQLDSVSCSQPSSTHCTPILGGGAMRSFSCVRKP